MAFIVLGVCTLVGVYIGSTLSFYQDKNYEWNQISLSVNL